MMRFAVTVMETVQRPLDAYKLRSDFRAKLTFVTRDRQRIE